MKVTVVATVLNNEETVDDLVASLLLQSRAPDEIIIVDGGSKDATLARLRGLEEKHAKLRVLTGKLNKAQSRNWGIFEAKHNVIAQIDGSCVASPDWLKHLVSPLRDKEVGVSAGFYTIETVNTIAKAAAPFMGVTYKKFDHRTYMPTGRSLAIRKKIWKKMGGYSEDLQWSGEDNLFNYKLLSEGVKIARVPEALVCWYAPSTLTRAAKKAFAYTAGIAQSGTWSHPCESLATINVNIMAVYARYIFTFVLLWLVVVNPVFLFAFITYAAFYVFSSLWKKKDEIDDQKALMLVPLMQLVFDVMVISGFASGYLHSKLVFGSKSSRVKYSKWGILEKQHQAFHG